jgi:phage/plasmid-associated DNA primase
METTFRSEIDDKRRQLDASMEDLPPDQRERVSKLLKAFTTFAGKFKSERFKTSLRKVLMRFYTKPDFEKIVDEARRLTVCRNGVLEVLSTERIVLRDGKPEDYCSKTTNVLFPLSKPVAKLAEIDHYFTQLFGHESENNTKRLLFERWCCSYLIGGNEKKKCLCLEGDSNTGKSELMRYIFLALGEYAIRGSKAMITFNPSGASKSGPAPDLIRTKGIRALNIDELDSKTLLDDAAIRLNTGGDPQPGRDLYGDARSIQDLEQQYKMSMIFNKRPKLADPSVDATWGRFINFGLKSRFMENPRSADHLDGYPETIEEQYRIGRFPIDPRFKEKIKSWGPAILWKWVQMYPDYATKGFPHCQSVVDATADYRRNADLYVEFTQTAIIQSAEGRTTVTQMYTHFKFWFSAKFPASKPHSENIFLMELRNKGVNPDTTTGVFVGWATRQGLIEAPVAVE